MPRPDENPSAGTIPPTPSPGFLIGENGQRSLLTYGSSSNVSVGPTNVNLQSAGADMSGGTASDVAWTTAKNQLPPGGGKIYIPPGIVSWINPVIVPIGVTIEGDGWGSVQVRPFPGFTGTQLFDILGNNTAIRNLEFSANSSLYSNNPAVDCIRIFGANTVSIERCTGYFFNGWFINAIPNGTANPFGLYLANLFNNQAKQGIHLQGQAVGGYSVAAQLINVFMNHKQAGDGLFLDGVHDVLSLNYSSVLDGGASAFSCIHMNDNCAGIYFIAADCGGVAGGAYTGTAYKIEHVGGGTRPNNIQFLGGVTSAQGIGMSVDCDDFDMTGHTFLQCQGNGIDILGSGDGIRLRGVYVRQSNLAASANKYDINCANTTGWVELDGCSLESIGVTVTANLLSQANLRHRACKFYATTPISGTNGPNIQFPGNMIYGASSGNGHFFQVGGVTQGAIQGNGDYSLTNHLVSLASGIPSTSNLGVNVTSATFNGNDVRGELTIVMSAGLAANTRVCTCTFANSYGATPPKIILVDQTSTAGLAIVNSYVLATSTGVSFDLAFDQALVAGTYKIDYIVIG